MNFCPNCGTSLQGGESFCGICGTKLSVGKNNIVQNQGGYQNYENINNDDAFIDAYIGKNINIIKNNSFSTNVFFFGSIYIFYRKMWLLGFLWLVISIIIGLFIPFSSIIQLAINIVIALQFKKIYLNHVREKVKKIKSENPGKSKEELLMICSKKGGTTIVPVVIFSIFLVLVFFASVFFYSFVHFITQFDK